MKLEVPHLGQHHPGQNYCARYQQQYGIWDTAHIITHELPLVQSKYLVGSNCIIFYVPFYIMFNILGDNNVCLHCDVLSYHPMHQTCL